MHDLQMKQLEADSYNIGLVMTNEVEHRIRTEAMEHGVQLLASSFQRITITVVLEFDFPTLYHDNFLKPLNLAVI
jgi:hypothetical protein